MNANIRVILIRCGIDRVDTDLHLAVLGNRHGRELWREFLLLALGLLLAEHWIARVPRDVPVRQAA